MTKALFEKAITIGRDVLWRERFLADDIGLEAVADLRI